MGFQGAIPVGGSGWAKATASVGVPGLHFHDLRHTGNTLAAQTGVSLADLKARMGHDSVRAAMIYQHASSAADRRIANALDQAIGRPAAGNRPSRRRRRGGPRRG
jgi:integrase